MAKLLPFVSKNTPVNEIVNKICMKYESLTTSTKLQLINIVVSEGIEKVEESVKDLGPSVSVVLRLFSHVPAIPSKTLFLISYFLKFLKMVPLRQNTCSREFNDMVSDEAKEIFITFLIFNKIDTYRHLGYGLTSALNAAHYRKSLSEHKLFSSNSGDIVVFANSEELEAYLLLAYLDPGRMFETLDHKKEQIFPTPVKAVFREGYSS